MELVVAPPQVVKGKPLYVGLAERKEAGKRILQLKPFLYLLLPCLKTKLAVCSISRTSNI